MREDTCYLLCAAVTTHKKQAISIECNCTCVPLSFKSTGRTTTGDRSSIAGGLSDSRTIDWRIADCKLASQRTIAPWPLLIRSKLICSREHMITLPE